MSDAEQARGRRGPMVAAVGGWLSGVASALFAVVMIVGSLKAEREWGLLGGVYALRGVVLVGLLAWVAGLICFGLGWLSLRANRPLALTAGVFWLILAATALVATLIGVTGGRVSLFLIMGLIVMLISYAVTAVALKDLVGSEPGGPGVWGFSLAAAFMLLSVLSAFIQMPLVFVSAIGLVWVGAAIGFIATGMTLVKTRPAA